MTPFFDTLGDELTAAANRRATHRKRRSVILVTVAAAVVLLIAVLGVAALDGGHKTADASDVSIDRNGERVSLVLHRLQANSSDVLDALEAEGLDAMTVEVRTGPSRDGAVLGLSTPSAVMAIVDGEARLDVPAGETVTVRVGRSDGTGLYDAPTDALAPGEPLRCVAWIGQAAADLERVDQGTELRFVDDRAEPVRDLSGLVVERAEAQGPNDVLVFVAPGAARDAPACDR